MSDANRTMLKGLVDAAEVSRSQKRQLEQLLFEWTTVCIDSLGCTSNITHRINTKDEIPVRRKAYPTPVHKQKFIDDEIAKMLEKRIIRPSTSPWAVPVVLVPKKDGSKRFCVDYRALKTKTPLDDFPMPQVHDILTSLYGATFLVQWI